ncbi:hypothetical protein CBL_20160, partial [Carabus blaptoides fortunei]
QQVEDIKLASALSIAIDESCEELFGLLPLKGQTRGEDIANAVKTYLEHTRIDLNRIISIATDGAKNMTEQIKLFLRDKGIEHLELEEDKWLQKFHFMVDITSHLNALNVMLQGKGNVAYTLLEEVECFENKLQVFAEDIEKGELLHFKFLKEYRDERSAGFDANYFSAVLRKMKNSFGERFQQFRANKPTLAFIVRPLKTNVKELNLAPFGTDAASLQMQLIDIQSKELWNNKFTDLSNRLEELEREKSNLISQHKWTAMKQLPTIETIIFDSWNSLPERYDVLKKLAFAILTVFALHIH